MRRQLLPVNTVLKNKKWEKYAVRMYLDKFINVFLPPVAFTLAHVHKVQSTHPSRGLVIVVRVRVRVWKRARP